MNRTLASIAALCLTCGMSLAHDFWLEPNSFRPEPGSIIAVHVLVGHGDERTPFVRKDEHIERFVLVGADGERPLVGRPDDDPAGLVRLDQQGQLLVGYRSKSSRIELAAEKFEAYLREEGLEHVIEEREERGESELPGRESYSRCAKALVTVGPDATTGFDRRLGFELEIVPENDPTGLAWRDELGRHEPLTVRVLHGETGLANALVGAHLLDDPSVELHLRTDDEGRVRLELPRAGRWMLTAVHMERAPQGADHDWSSLWASMTFELRAPAFPAAVDDSKPPR